MLNRVYSDDNSYERSNEELRIIGAKSFPVKYRSAIVNSEIDTAQYRRKAAQDLVDCVCECLGIKSVKVVVLERSRPHRKSIRGSVRSQTLGQYKYSVGIDKQPISITIWNLTAVRQQRVSNKMFLGTLEHELVHHYDIVKLKLNKSAHTTGFYKRIEILDGMFK